MTTSSKVRSDLDAIGQAIVKSRARLAECQRTAKEVSAALSVLPQTYSGAVTAVGKYGSTDAFEAVSKAELAKLTSELNALKADADAIAAINLG